MKKVLYIIIGIVVLLGLFKILSTPNKNVPQNVVSPDQSDLVVFVQKGCVHCENVEKFVQDNNLMSKMKINYTDIRENSQNLQLLEDTVKKCPEIDASQGVGTPLGYLTKENKCLYGDTPIIDYLKSKFSISQ